jgi:glycerate-2-kinase
MASALDERLGAALVGGVLSGPPSDLKLSERWRVYRGGHPLPNEASLEAARAAFDLLRAADDAKGLVVFLVSGGGSAMLELTRDGRVTLEDLREANRVLVSCGAPIDEVNAVRRALSAVKGGGLAARLTYAQHVTLVVSDVARGRDFDVASGPTLPPTRRAPSAAEVVARYRLARRLPSTVLRSINESGGISGGITARLPPSESPGAFQVLLGNGSACLTAVRAALSRGFAVEWARVISDQPVDRGAAALAAQLFSLDEREGAVGRRGVCIISGGEFSCPVRGGGTGGRNSETALRVAFELERLFAGRRAQSGLIPRHALALCAGTDGIDGNSPAAGALADETTRARAGARGLDARKFLEESDAYTFFNLLGDALVTGPTGTNVRDVRVLLAV